ncbi:MAG: murein L,D-transpeptidase [Verrucomicrobiae bacterium]|nr:murein L,D-transpeptidase [Verrucomicrobiae bacterium]
MRLTSNRWRLASVVAISFFILHPSSFILRAQVASSLAEWQIALDRQNFFPGCIDGKLGTRTKLAISAWQESHGMRVDGVMGPDTEKLLIGTNADWFTQYTLTEDDLKNIASVPLTWKGKSEQPTLTYETVIEMIAEKFHATEQIIQTLNSDVNFAQAKAGQALNVPNVMVPKTYEKAHVVRVKLSKKVIVAYGDNDQIIGFFPCSIGADKAKRPVGELKVIAIAPKPNFTWDPAVFAESPEAQTIKSKLIIPPGPNNPVGVYWIGLNRTGYGMHGTPKPEDIGKTESHGCFRLANWNVLALAEMIEIGTPLIVEP